MTGFQSLLDLLKKRQFQDFQGTFIRAEIPLAEGFLNDLFRQRVGELEQVDLLQLHLPGQQRLNVRVKARVDTNFLGIKIPFKREFSFRIDPEIELSDSPTLRLQIEEGFTGLDRTVLPWVENIISRSFPGNFNLRENLLLIDFGEILRERELGFLIPFIRQAAVEGQVGRLLIRIDIKI